MHTKIPGHAYTVKLQDYCKLYEGLIYNNLFQVVLSQGGGSNKGGFTVLHSNAKNTIHLDGIFNIISYDVVPKLQQVLLASDFKVTAVSLIFIIVSSVCLSLSIYIYYKYYLSFFFWFSHSQYKLI